MSRGVETTLIVAVPCPILFLYFVHSEHRLSLFYFVHSEHRLQRGTTGLMCAAADAGDVSVSTGGDNCESGRFIAEEIVEASRGRNIKQNKSTTVLLYLLCPAAVWYF